MNISIATPVAAGSRRGNRVTAERWARLLGELGHSATLVGGDAVPGEAELLIALHACRSHGALTDFRRRFPDRPLVVVLGGTDLYRDMDTDPRVRESLDMADRIVILQERAAERLTPMQAAKARVIEQSCSGPPVPAPALDPPANPKDLLLVGHLREVKDPFLAARALDLLADTSALRLVHLGAALDVSMEAEAQDRARRSDRYLWLGERSRDEALTRMAACRALLLTSKDEGGANVITEAITCGAAILATACEGTMGQLGVDHPGLFPVGDESALAKLLQRLVDEPAFEETLRAASIRLRPRAHPDRERAAWRDLLADLE
jgi:putative glycosyltransferase (TIGR04348 family)